MNTLQFRLRAFHEHEATDSLAQGADDEVFLSAIGVDSLAVTVGPNGEAIPRLINAAPIGDVSEDAVRNPWGANPHALLAFDLGGRANWPRDREGALLPRSFTSTLLIVEEDNQEVAETFEKLHDGVGKEIRTAVVTTAATTGGTIGTLIFPGLGTALGAAIGALGGFAYDALIAEIISGLRNEVFKPQSLTLQVANPTHLRSEASGRQQVLRIEEDGAVYDLFYDWYVVDERASFRSTNFPDLFIRHANYLGEISPIGTPLDRADSTFVLRPGLNGNTESVSFESVNFPGQYLRHNFFRLKLHANDGADLFRNDASFIERQGLADGGAVSYESVNFPGHFIRHRDFHLWVERNDDSELFRKDATFSKGAANQ